MYLVYTPKEGFMAPPIPWPARDHEEDKNRTARRKIKSGFYVERVDPEPGPETSAGTGVAGTEV